MFKESEKTKEKSKRKTMNKNHELERNSVKKSTISLSEIPKIINDELNSDIRPKKKYF